MWDKSKILIITTLLCLHYNGIQGQSKLDEVSAHNLMQQVNALYWESAPTYRKFADDTLSPEILMRENLRQFYPTMQQYDWQNFQDPLLKRQFEVILRGAKYPPMDFKFKNATKTLKGMSRQKWACKRDRPNQCNMAYVHHIKSIVTNSNDLEEIKYYWEEWRNKMPNGIKDALLYYVSYYQNMTTPTMNASSIWYDQYEDSNLLTELEEMMETIRPFYRELHAHIRHVLRQTFGNILPADGLIPHHLLEQVTYQAWKKESVIKNPFPERRLPNLQAEMNDNNIMPFDMVNISALYFASLGFQNLSKEFMSQHFFEMEPGTGGPDCKARIFDFGEIELNYCPKVNYKKLLQSHGDMARIEYAIAKNNNPVGLNEEACPGFGNAIGEAIILSVSNPKHLQKRLNLLENYEYDDILNLNRLFRLAVHTLLTVPTYFVHEKLWVDMIEGKVKPENYNCHYWKLMEEYMGVGAPARTVNGAYDMPYKFYEGIVDQYRSTKKVFGEFLGYQIYRAICLNIGEFQRGNAYKVLDNCDFSDNRQAGQFIRDLMTPGSSKPWRELIKTLTIRKLPKLTATAFLEYYEPLHNWLSDDNTEKNVNVGWSSVNSCPPAQVGFRRF